ncbi:glycine-rich RNA-binding protein 2, mitochondrial-like [Dioscorea cayenensis subsp. rotundata]|uniref:Glycine-rich RNA-binding protein 2, mitochondrial-like n=1 Tax=Dioscorea cayennensis subsp. rotundata TaxID=55577 RepID=A0AB40CLT4_DIOCR|nr:glycine-rich RNA-binding protein 2, mitochondrial-like [Dioscorea cayenensis subsp. rotundata]
MAFAKKIGTLFKQTLNSNPSIYQAIRCMSSSKVFVGGLSYSTDDNRLREAFSSYGEVVEARVIMDRETGRSRGFGFVTFESGEEASGAISGLDGKDLDGRLIRVNHANDRTGGFRGGGYGGGGYGGGAGGYGGGGGGGYGGGGYGGGGSYGGGGGGNYGGDGYNNASTGYGGNAGDLAGGRGSSGNYFGGPTEFASSGSTGGYEGSGAMGYGDNISHQSGSPSTTGPEQNDHFGGNFRDDDDQPDDYANRQG